MEPNPVGTPRLQVIDNAVKEVMLVWEQIAPNSTWWTRTKGAWVAAVRFLIKATDYLIRQIDDVLDNGPDKKATVLAVIDKLYDLIVPPLLPLWLKPFNSRIKRFVIYVVISLMIDFIVEKYREGDWLKEEPNHEQVEMKPVEPKTTEKEPVDGTTVE